MTTSPNGNTAQRRTLRIAVVQPHLAVGAVEMNLRLCASLVREASVMHSPDVILLPEGNYHVVSNYGNSNATVRSDIRVQLGKLTDVVVNHRAAVITLKLVAQSGGEALANTQWSVLTPGGDVVKEAIGAFPKVVLAEGEYSVVAKNDEKTFNGKFKVEPGVDREIEVLAR